MGWTAETNYDSIGVKSILQITDGGAGVRVRTLRLPAGVELTIQHPNGHITKAHIISASRTSGEIRLSDRTRWHITPFDPANDLPPLITPGQDVQVWVVRKKIA